MYMLFSIVGSVAHSKQIETLQEFQQGIFCQKGCPKTKGRRSYAPHFPTPLGPLANFAARRCVPLGTIFL